MIQSKYKYNTQLGVTAGKLAFKLRSKKKDILINIFVPIALVLIVGVLIFDIHKNNSIVLDIVLIVLLAIVEILNIFMPLIITRSQTKYLKHIEAQNYDYYISEYNKHIFKEKIYKDNKLMYANEITSDKLVNYAEFDHYLLLVFNNFASLIFDLDSMQEGTKEELLAAVTNILATNQLSKLKRK